MYQLVHSPRSARYPFVFRLFKSALLFCAALGLAPLPLGCLDRPAVGLSPITNNIFVDQVTNDAVTAIDLLFVIDNSVSMADKQALLRQAVPLMVERLVTPDCVSEAGERRRNDQAACASYGPSFAPEFSPVDDIHIGVISSSIGGFGGPECASPETRPEEVDKALLMPKVRATTPLGETVPDPTDRGFLTWNGTALGATDAVEELKSQFALHVAAAGESGCGFEAPLEAWYRFLVDPSPPVGLELVRVGTADKSRSLGVDSAILAQRAEFLRPGSLLAIVVLTDEDDCSAMEGGDLYPRAESGWAVASRKSLMTLASAACETNPNDQCCYSCLDQAPDGCVDTCVRPAETVPKHEDRINARCIAHRRRFGLDLLYPTSRYVDGLKSPWVLDRETGARVPNPLLQGRAPDRIFFAGIIGVPWQDIATQDSLSDPQELRYLRADALDDFDPAIGGDRWDLVLGKPGLHALSPECTGGEAPEECGRAPVPPLDPFMIQSQKPRAGTNPLTGESTVMPGTMGWSPINGHEFDNSIPVGDGLPANDDLQYSCIFPLAEEAVKVSCDTSGQACDCNDEPSKNRPLCKATPNVAAPADTTQRYGKAYPAPRILRVLRDFGENSIVGSICPKILDTTSSSFGYNPAVNAIVDRLVDKIRGQCLPRQLDISDGNVPCRVVETSQTALDCQSLAGRNEVGGEVRLSVEEELIAGGKCTREPSQGVAIPLCSSISMCEILPLEADARTTCFGTTPAEQQGPGYCYIDPAKGPTSGGLPGPEGGCKTEDPGTWDSCVNPNLKGCGSAAPRLLRFVGEGTPSAGSTTYVACQGTAVTD